MNHTDHRRLEDLVNIYEGKRYAGHTEIHFAGKNAAGKDVVFTVVMPFDYVPLLVNSLKRPWQRERVSRLEQIKQLDLSLEGAA